MGMDIPMGCDNFMLIYDCYDCFDCVYGCGNYVDCYSSGDGWGGGLFYCNGHGEGKGVKIIGNGCGDYSNRGDGFGDGHGDGWCMMDGNEGS